MRLFRITLAFNGVLKWRIKIGAYLLLEGGRRAHGERTTLAPTEEALAAGFRFRGRRRLVRSFPSCCFLLAVLPLRYEPVTRTFCRQLHSLASPRGDGFLRR